ncbi:MAG: hypothetical protein QNK37_23765 [Acidobacteriota bacterium]|nr:hypothetical protein [Acidobacteriota bacterium]
MNKKLTLTQLSVKSFRTKEDVRAGALARTNNYLECVTTNTWVSELYTACTCPETWDCTKMVQFCQ